MKKLFLLIAVVSNSFFIFSSVISPYIFDMTVYDFLLKDGDKTILPQINISKESDLTNIDSVDTIQDIFENEKGIVLEEEQREIPEEIKGIDIQEEREYKSNETKGIEENSTKIKERVEESDEKESGSRFKVKSALGYSVILDKTWSELITPILDIRVGCAFPEVKNGIFIFNVEAVIDYSISLLRERREFTHHTIAFKLPMVFNFKVGSKMQIGFSTSLYYSLCLMEYQEIYKSKSVYKDDVGGGNIEFRYTYKATTLLDLIMFVGLDIPFTKNMYKCVMMGVGLDWSI